MEWVETVLNGIFLGGLYGVLGLGLALVFGVMRVINVAHGEFIVLAAYLGFFLVSQFPDVHPLLLLVPVMIVCFVVGYGFQALLLNRVVETPDPLAPMLVTFGISIVLRNVMVETFGADPRSIQIEGLSQASLQLFGISIGILPLMTLIVAVGLFVALQLVLTRTSFGRIVRATADNPEVVRMMGARPVRAYNTVMGLALLLAGVAGLLLAMRTSFTAYSGIDRILISFEVVVLGGLGSFWGALIAGILLGIAQIVGLLFDGNGGLLYAHLLFFVFLLVRPSGLFGARA